MVITDKHKFGNVVTTEVQVNSTGIDAEDDMMQQIPLGMPSKGMGFSDGFDDLDGEESKGKFDEEEEN